MTEFHHVEEAPTGFWVFVDEGDHLEVVGGLSESSAKNLVRELGGEWRPMVRET